MSPTVLIVTEKPSIARAFVKTFSIVYKLKFKTIKGIARYNRIFTGKLTADKNIPFLIKNQRFVLKEGDKIVITSVLGHLYNYDYPYPYDKETNWHNTDPLDLVRQQPIEKPINDDIITQLKDLGKEADIVVIATDWDGHGESIGRQILQTITLVNSKVYHGRMRFTSINPLSIKRAFEEQVELDWNLIKQIDSLRKQDLRMGASLTRFFTVGVQRFSNIRSQVISYGPVQSPILYLITNRYLETEDFSPKKFWLISVRITYEGKDIFFDWRENPSEDEILTEKLVTSLRKSPIGTVVDSQEQKSVIKRPIPLDTDTLEAECSRLFRISPKRVADIAEQLYNQGFITYPRTESSYYHQKDFTSLVDQFKDHPDFGEFATDCIKVGGTTNPSKGKYSKDHEPIRPIKVATTSEIEKVFSKTPRNKTVGWNIYSYIVMRFLATVHRDITVNRSIVVLAVNDEEFIAKGEVIKEPGFLTYYPYVSITENKLPLLEKGSKWDVVVLKNHGFTTPPPLFSESQLIREMARLNIGTDATRSTHVNTVQERNYAILKNGSRNLIPTSLGLALYRVLMENAKELILPEIRGKVEGWTKEIREHTKTPEEVDKLVIDITTHGIQQMKTNEEEIFSYLIKGIQKSTGEGRIIGFCPKCKSDLVLNYGKKNSRFLRCSNGFCNETYSLPKQGEIEILSGDRCKICGNEPIMIVSGTKKWVMCPVCWSKESKDDKPWFCSSCNVKTCSYSGNFSPEDKKKELGQCPICNGMITLTIDYKNFKTTIECKNCHKTWKSPNPRKNTVIELGDPCTQCGKKTLLIKRLNKKAYRICVFCSLFYFD